MTFRPKQTLALVGDIVGSSTIEFALVGLMLFWIVFGIVEAGRMLWTLNALKSTALDTARCVAIGSSRCSNGQTYAVSVAAGRGIGSLTTSEVTITTTAGTSCTNSSNLGLNFTSVSITHAYQTMVPFFPAPSNLKTTACFPNNS